MSVKKGDLAGVLFGLLLLAGLGQTYGSQPLGFDMADNPFNPYTNYNPSTYTGTCQSDDPCQLWDFMTNTWGVPTAGFGSCAINTLDTDGDGTVAYRTSGGFAGDWSNIDAGCLMLQDWDQDGTCDHRVYDGDRDQVMTDYQPTDIYYTYIGAGSWAPAVGPSVCTGWVGV